MKTGKTILIIEDNLAYARLIQKRLESRGYGTVVATDGLDGYNLARKIRPDLILLDLMLPGMDGHKICHLLKFDQNLRNTPIAIFTSHDTEADKSIALAARADAYMPKPVSTATMLEIVRSLLEKAERYEVEHIRFKGEDVTVMKSKREQLECVAEFPEKLREIGTFIRQNDAEQIEKKVHSLKGNIGLLGAERAYIVADALEVMARESDLHEAGDTFSKLEAEVHRVQNFLLNPYWMEFSESSGFAN
jgi:DNA-binding response OmpR family regulator